MTKERLDKLLIEKRIVQSRERARALILEGKVVVGDRTVDKPGTRIEMEAEVRLRGEDQPYVSRGGIKLEGALDRFGIDPKGWVVMDVGASTGGFTDCILQRGAKRVYAVDVGYGQLAWKLRRDPRVVNLERRNIRYLKREEVEEEMDLILVDTSFISIEKFLPHLLHFLKKGGSIVGLLKPQFEVGKGEVGKGGVVRDRALHQRVIERISQFSRGLGLKVLGVTESPILGPKGNREFFIYLRKEEPVILPLTGEDRGRIEGDGQDKRAQAG
ncbi:MAG: TlyA family RNA methyltransferase [Syntrophaceae bacterium]|nr:TlyA family RNA methyltransferase [Syntrophaceae bacterium]